MKYYKVYYVGDDSLGHKKVVRAKDHDDAIEKAQRATGADIITGVSRCENPYVIIGVIVLVALLLLALLIVSFVHSA